MSNHEAGLRVAHVMIQGMPQTTEKVGVLTQAVRDYVRERLTEEHFEDLAPDAVEKAHRERQVAFVLLGLLEGDPTANMPYAMSGGIYDHDVALLINSVMISDQYRAVLVDVINEAIIQNAVIQGLYPDEDDDRDEVQFAIARIQMFLEMLKKLGVAIPDELKYVEQLMVE
jgi:hypothetical protein